MSGRTPPRHLRKGDLLRHHGEVITAAALAERHGVPWSTVRERFFRAPGRWSKVRACTTPVMSLSAAGRRGKAASPWRLEQWGKPS